MANRLPRKKVRKIISAPIDRVLHIHIAADPEEDENSIQDDHAAASRFLMRQKGFKGWQVNKGFKVDLLRDGGIWTLRCRQSNERALIRGLGRYENLIISKDWEYLEDLIEDYKKIPFSINCAKLYKHRPTNHSPRH